MRARGAHFARAVVAGLAVSVAAQSHGASPPPRYKTVTVNRKVCTEDGRKGKVRAIVFAGPADPDYPDARDADQYVFDSDVDNIESSLKALGIDIIMKIKYEKADGLKSQHRLDLIRKGGLANNKDCDTTIFAFVGHGSASGLSTGTEWTTKTVKGQAVRHEDTTVTVALQLALWAKSFKGEKIFVLDACGAGSVAEAIWVAVSRTDPNAKKTLVVIGSTAASEGSIYAQWPVNNFVPSFNQKFFSGLKDRDCKVLDTYSAIGEGSIHPPNTSIAIPCVFREIDY